jgi:hypothetical protein
MPWHSEGCKSEEAETGDREGRGNLSRAEGGIEKTPTSEHIHQQCEVRQPAGEKRIVLILRKNRPVLHTSEI